MRLIDADALEKFLKRLRLELPKESQDSFTRDTMILNFQQYVHMQPTIDAEPVVHGRIESNGDCSECGCQIPTDDRLDYISKSEVRYCYYCGAKIEGEQNEA